MGNKFDTIPKKSIIIDINLESPTSKLSNKDKKKLVNLEKNV